MDPSHAPALGKLPPKFDAVFLRLFNEDDHARLLISLLNGLLKLPSRLRIVELTLLPPRIQDTAAQKQVVLDIRAVSVMGDRYNLDVQVSPFAEYASRAVYYLTGLHHGQLPARAPYARLRPAISVHVLDFPLFSDEPRYHQIFELRERMTNSLLTDQLQLHFVELPKFALELGELVDPEQKWVYFLKHGDQMTREQAQALGIAEIAEAERKLTMISQDQILQMQHEQWEKALRDQVARELDWIEHGRKEGLREGEKKGRKEGLSEGEKKGRKEGLSEGRKEGLQQGIRTLCEVFSIPLTPGREQALAALDAADLQALLAQIQRTRRWD